MLTPTPGAARCSPPRARPCCTPAIPAAARLRFGQARAIARRTRDAPLLARAALGHGGLGVEIMDVDSETVGLLEEALNAIGTSDPGLTSALLARLAVELYYSPSRDRTDPLSAEAVAAARRTGDPRTIAVALNARHVGLWRPDRLADRRAVADDMIAAAQAASDPMLQLQARNWRVVDLFEAGDMSEWRAEVARHGALAAELRVPAYTWYTTLWAAVDALHAGRFEEAAELRERARTEGTRAGDRNADLFAEMLGFEELAVRGDFAGVDLTWLEHRIATSATGAAYRAAYAWILAVARPRVGGARAPRSDRSRRLRSATVRRQLALRSRRGRRGRTAARRPRRRCAHILDRPDARMPAARPQPAAPSSPTAASTASSATPPPCSAAASEAIAHYEAAIRIDAAAGFTPWADRARNALDALRGGSR